MENRIDLKERKKNYATTSSKIQSYKIFIIRRERLGIDDMLMMVWKIFIAVPLFIAVVEYFVRLDVGMTFTMNAIISLVILVVYTAALCGIIGCIFSNEIIDIECKDNK